MNYAPGMAAQITSAVEAARLAALRSYAILDTLPEQAFDDITLLAAHICDAPIALVSLVDEDRQWFKSHHGLDATETPRDWAFCAHAIATPDAPFVVSDATRDARFRDNPLVIGEPEIRFYVGAPLVTDDGHALGTLCAIDRVPRELTPRQMNCLVALSRQVMAQLELHRVVRQLATETTTDSLTGVDNRRGFDLKIRDEMARSNRYGNALALLLVDIDHFKRFNDTHGHPAGDRALRRVAAILETSVRATDTVARLGGEEFAIILPNTTPEGAFTLAERCRLAIAQADWPGAGVTVSVGISNVEPSTETVEQILERTDQALYEAKDQGRNRSVVSR